MKVNVQKLFSLDGHRDCIYSLEQGQKSNLFYSASGDGMVVEWDMNNPETGHLIANMKNSVFALHHLQKENILVIGQNFNGIHLIDLHSKNEIGSLEISNERIFEIKSYKNSLFIGSGDGVLTIVDLASMSIIKRTRLSDKSIRSIAVNNKLGELAIGLSDNSIHILKLDDLKQKYLIDGHRASVFSVVYNPENNQLISAGRDASIKSWNPFNHYELGHSVVAHMFAINSLSFSPDFKYFVSGSMDKSIKVWDSETFRLLKVLDKSRHAGHLSSVNKVLWTKHKNQMLSCSDDKKISIWDLGFN